MTIAPERPALLPGWAPPPGPTLDDNGQAWFDGAPVSLRAKAWLPGVTNTGRLPGHGELRRYAYWGCRCDRCRAAARRWVKLGRAGLRPTGFTPIVRAQRQVQALNAIGFSHERIAGESRTLGGRLTKRMVWAIAAGRIAPSRGLVCRTADTVDAVYEALVDAPTPTDGYAARVRRTAEKLGYAPPEAWLDETIGDPDAWPYKGIDTTDPEISDEAAAVLKFITLNPWEGRQARKPSLWGNIRAGDRVTVLRELAARGLTFNRIAINLGVHTTAMRQWCRRRKLFSVVEGRLVPWSEEAES